ncbi:hypothetical protein RO3G_05378 [Rhizopus delemar RA 99-880]|uniref:Tc1-like transposase DDE domain-containing protein n=1 Tax=Rhizopus delemar (strain RA 99-880 / ATCC MYA-4621 / FGSC 9543 / NRRL 43880) TaxID=246409 RepID=I1BWU3_RHIO9|nr:hypothetical protein RO3G_05378 [Rhizopus delemar RA 99-880]|eukprot:EIE80673.1 hypothetical protein RO3G_05378 [Rhizopus delemar RA 99-880]
MDNVPIHIFEDIAKYIVSQGYRCAYLPSYSSKLRLIDQFWSVVKINDTAYKDIDYYTHMSISGGAKLMNSN